MPPYHIANVLAGHFPITRPAILAPDYPTLSHADLFRRVQEWIRDLQHHGIQRNSRVAIVLPEGVQLALTFLSVSACAVCVPVNPSYNPPELESYFTRTGVRYVITTPDHPALDVAHRLGLSVIEAIPHAERILRFSPPETPVDPFITPPHPDDLALILSTSGTTYKPKLVPITHGVLCKRAELRIQAYQLTSDDRLLNVMPMIHSSSLTYVVAMLMVGGSIICPNGFRAQEFFPLVERYHPTWCSASASIYQTVLTYAPLHADVVKNHSFRFLRAGTMALPDHVWQQLQDTFRIPVIQGYGSSETGTVTATPLGMNTTKPGSAGVSIGLELRIVGDSGDVLPVGACGELTVRGDTVISGYEGDDTANVDTFRDGWYRTGDYGYMDSDGYLFLLGRLKEAINRGGEKIFPGEVEDVLNMHPHVKEAAVFGVSDQWMGEIVAAAIIPADDSADERAIREYATKRLAYFKVPEHVYFVQSIPRTPNGKPIRRTLSDQFRDHPHSNRAGSVVTLSASDTANAVRALWAEILARDVESIRDDAPFRELGGDSLSAARLVSTMRARMGVNITLLDVFDAPTIAAQVGAIEAIRARNNTTRTDSYIIPLQPHGSKPPLFCVHALRGGALMYEALIPYLDADRPMFGLQAVGIDGEHEPMGTVEAMAVHQVALIRSIQPEGHYVLCGFSFGGKVGLETARILREQHGAEVDLLIIDTGFHLKTGWHKDDIPGSGSLWRWLALALWNLPPRYKVMVVARILNNRVRGLLKLPIKQYNPSYGVEPDLTPTGQHIENVHTQASMAYDPQPYHGDVTYLFSRDERLDYRRFREIERLVRGKLTIIDIPGYHNTLLRSDIATTGAQVRKWLGSVTRTRLHGQLISR
jgi:oxalate---CoA ligase